MHTFNIYLQRLRRAITASADAAMDLQKRKADMIRGGGTGLQQFIEHEELPLVEHIRADIAEILSGEERIVEIAGKRGTDCSSLLRFLKRSKHNLKLLRKALKKEKNAIARNDLNFFFRIRESEELPVHRRIETSIDALHLPHQNPSLANIASSRSLPVLARVAAVLLIVISLISVSKAGSFQYTVKQGDHIGTLLRFQHLMPAEPEEALQQANPDVNLAILFPGQKINIPLRKGAEKPRISKSRYASDGNFWDEPREVVLARCIFGEAEGCSQEAKEAVAACVLDRVSSESFPDALKEVLLQPKAFSCFLPTEPTYPKVKDPETYNAGEWRQCLDISRRALAGQFRYPMPLALHYRDSSLDDLKEPYVMVARIPTGKGGYFHFYLNEKDKVGKHFRVKEFVFPGCRYLYLDRVLIQKLDLIREHFRRPVRIVRVWGNPPYGYASNVDISIVGFSDEQMQHLANQLGTAYADGGLRVSGKGYGQKPNIDIKTGKQVDLVVSVTKK